MSVTEPIRSTVGTSTGPRTSAGKRQSSRNAIKHGLSSTSPVLPGEDPKVWEMYRCGIIESLNPANFLEREIGETVARLWWKRRRLYALSDMREHGLVDEHIRRHDCEQEVVTLRERCETLHHRVKDTRSQLRLVQRLLLLHPTSKLQGSEAIEVFDLLMSVSEVEDLKDRLAEGDFLEVSGYCPETASNDVQETASNDELDLECCYDDFSWTRRLLDKGLRYIAEQEKVSVRKLLAGLHDKVARLIEKWERGLKCARSDLIKLESELFYKHVPSICELLLAESSVKNTIHRYEAHIGKQITLALQQLASLREIGLDSRKPTLKRKPGQKSPVGCGKGGTATEIEELSAHQCKDNGVFNTAKLQPDSQELPSFAG